MRRKIIANLLCLGYDLTVLTIHTGLLQAEVSITGLVSLRLPNIKKSPATQQVCCPQFVTCLSKTYLNQAKYSVGWMSTLSWLASLASSVFVVTTLIQVLIDVAEPGFVFPNWQYTLIMLAVLVLTILFNTWGAKVLPMFETISLFGHIGGFVITLIPLWVLAPKNSAHAVFAEVVNNGGWSSAGTSCLVAQVTVLYCNLGEL